jgi:hypothetical protein
LPSPIKNGWGRARMTNGSSFSGWNGRTRTVCQLGIGHDFLALTGDLDRVAVGAHRGCSSET